MNEAPAKKKKKTVSMTKRSMDYLRDLYYDVCVVEQWFEFPERINGIPTGKMIKQRRDAFGFADLIAVNTNKTGTLYIQTTTLAHRQERMDKIIAAPAVYKILEAGNHIELHCWRMNTINKQKIWRIARFELGLGAHRALYWTEDFGDGVSQGEIF